MALNSLKEPLVSVTRSSFNCEGSLEAAIESIHVLTACEHELHSIFFSFTEGRNDRALVQTGVPLAKSVDLSKTANMFKSMLRFTDSRVSGSRSRGSLVALLEATRLNMGRSLMSSCAESFSTNLDGRWGAICHVDKIPRKKKG